MSTMSFKEGFMTFYLPAIMIVCGFIVAGTCLSAGPFIPVGLSGIVALAVIAYTAVTLIKRGKKVQELNDTLSAEESRIESINRRNASDLAKKDSIIAELKDTVLVLQNKVNTLQEKVKELESANQKPNDKDNPVELPEPTVKPEVKKKTSKKK